MTRFVIARAAHRGMVLPLVVGLMLIAILGLAVFFQTVRQEARSTHKLVRTLHAEAICDMVVSRMAGMVGQKPWQDRFYLLAAMQQFGAGGVPPQAKYAFDHDAFPFGNEGPEYASGDAMFSGWIKDVDALEKRYRVMVWSTYQGVSVLATYDLRYCEGTMGPLNRTCMDLRTVKTDDLPLPNVVDTVMDAIPMEVHRPENLVPGVPTGGMPATFGSSGYIPPNTGAQVAGVVEETILPSYDAPVAVASDAPAPTPVQEATETAKEQAEVSAATEYEQALQSDPAASQPPTLRPVSKDDGSIGLPPTVANNPSGPATNTNGPVENNNAPPVTSCNNAPPASVNNANGPASCSNAPPASANNANGPASCSNGPVANNTNVPASCSNGPVGNANNAPTSCSNVPLANANNPPGDGMGNANAPSPTPSSTPTPTASSTPPPSPTVMPTLPGTPTPTPTGGTPTPTPTESSTPEPTAVQGPAPTELN